MIVRFGSFGALPKPDSLVSGDVTGDGLNGLGPGNRWVSDFANRYAKAMKLSMAAETYPVGTPIRTLQKKLDAALTVALQAVQANYLWDTGIFGRSAPQAARLVSALQDTNSALNYDKLELALQRDKAAQAAADAAAASQGLGPTSSSSGMTFEPPPSILPKVLMYAVPAAVLLIGGAVVLFKKPKPKPAVAGYSRRRRRRRR